MMFQVKEISKDVFLIDGIDRFQDKIYYHEYIVNLRTMKTIIECFEIEV